MLDDQYLPLKILPDFQLSSDSPAGGIIYVAVTELCTPR